MKYLITFMLGLLFIGNLFAQHYWQFSVSSGVISPKFLIESPLGYQFEGKIFYSFSDSLQLSLSSGYHSWKEPFGPGGNKLKTIPVLAGIKYLFPLGIFSPYFSGEFGAHIITRDYVRETYEPSTMFEGSYKLVSSKPEVESVVKFAYRLTIGTTLSINKNLDFDFGLLYNKILYDFIYIYYPSFIASTVGIYYYSFAIGLNYKL